MFEFLVLQQAQCSNHRGKTPATIMFLTFSVYQNYVESFYKSQANQLRIYEGGTQETVNSKGILGWEPLVSINIWLYPFNGICRLNDLNVFLIKGGRGGGWLITCEVNANYTKCVQIFYFIHFIFLSPSTLIGAYHLLVTVKDTRDTEENKKNTSPIIHKK